MTMEETKIPEKGDGEIIYQMTMQAAREMLQQELITRDEYLQFDTKMRQMQSADSNGWFCGAKRTRCGASGLIYSY